MTDMEDEERSSSPPEEVVSAPSPGEVANTSASQGEVNHSNNMAQQQATTQSRTEGQSESTPSAPGGEESRTSSTGRAGGAGAAAAADDADDDEDHLLNHDPTPSHHPYPSPTWFSVKHFQERELGRNVTPRNPRNKRGQLATFNPFWFRKHVYSSIYFLQRLELLEKLEEHNGCVNSLNFNGSGDLICSGSDDLQIAIWDWQRSQLRHKYHSGHSQNVFQAKFCVDGNHIVSCARDGQVRICDVRNTTMTLSRKLVQHRAAAHKLTLTTPQGQTILSCGEDAAVYEIDLRMDKPSKILHVKEGDKKMPLYSIHSTQQFSPEQFVVSGRSPFVHMYDRRFLTTASNSPAPLEKFCPTHLKTTSHTVTCAVFDSTCRSVLATYNDDDMYLFDSRNGELEHTYKGHRNSATVKGCSWFSDDFVLSGSDDGYVYGWDRESEHIVMSLYADETGVVNCLEPHPTSPFLATSGLDDNVKVWVPSAFQWPQTMKGIKQRICSNVRDRKVEQRRAAEHDDLDGVDSSMIWFIIRQLRQRQRRSGGSSSHAAPPSSDDDDDDDDEEDGDRGGSQQQCISS